MRHLIAVFVCLAGTSAGLNAEDFTQFRGPGGKVPAQAIPTDWSPEKNLAWKIPVPGSGWSQPVIVGDRLFVSTAVPAETWKPKNFADGTRTPASMGLGFLAKAPRFDFDWQVVCMSATDGSRLWSKTVTTGRAKFAVHPSNTYATETPVADQHGVYVYFGAAGKVAGFDLDGELLWQSDVGVFKTSNNFGTGSSLAIYDGKVFLQNYSEQSSSLMCFEAQTGQLLWEDKRDSNGTSWTSPLIWQHARGVELVASSGRELIGYNPADGERLWTLDNIKSPATATPASDSQRLYFGGSDPFSKGPLFAMSAGGRGKLSPKKKNKEFAQCDWMLPRAGPGMPSPVSTGKFVYVVDKNILRCYDAESGKRWYQTRIPNTNTVAASPLVIGDQLLVLDEDGQGSLIQVGPEFKVTGGGKLPDTFWATPAVANGSLYVRGIEFLYCIRDSAANTKS